MRVQRLSRLLTVLCLVSVCGAAHAGEIGPSNPEQGVLPISSIEGMERLQYRWDSLARVANIPGYAIAVIKDGEVVGLEAFGVRDGDGNPATVDTMYYIASITKVLTGEAICALAGEGKLDLDDRVKQHLPEMDLPDDKVENELTIRDLLSHRYGIRANGVTELEAYTGEITEERFFRGLSLGEVRGSLYYSNTHFTMLGYVIDRLSGAGWRDHLDNVLFDKAGMTRTTAYASDMYGDDDAAIPMLATGDNTFTRADVIKSDRMMHAAGGVGMSIRDAATWVHTMLNDGEAPNGERLLGSLQQREMFSLVAPYEKTDGSIRAMEGRGLAWEVGTWRGSDTRYAHHGGGFVGCATLMCMLPDTGHGVIVFTNVGRPGSIFTTMVTIDVIDALLGRETDDDLYASYIGGLIPRNMDRMFQMARLEPASRETITDALPLPLRAYEGVFTNSQWGTIELSLDAGRVYIRRGDQHAALARVEGEGNELIAINHNGETVVRVVSENGAVTALECEMQDNLWARYEIED
jgi:CubicO group peptidase (beta-lactamase class C family)